jgi:chemotaxis protein MotB
MRRRRHAPHVSHERWLVSYADFITLLFAFFTTMYAISTVDARKLSLMVESMQAAFAKGDVPSLPKRVGSGTSPGPRTFDLPKLAPGKGGPDQQVSVEELKARLDARLQAQVEQGLVDIEIDPRGLVVSIREAGSFATGKADLSPVAESVLREIGAALVDVGNFIRVEGHTDDVPIHTERYASNWELSTARATRVVAFFLDLGVAPGRLSAAGYGEYHPRVANDTEANRARNRRVDIVILNPVTFNREEPAAAGE